MRLKFLPLLLTAVLLLQSLALPAAAQEAAAAAASAPADAISAADELSLNPEQEPTHLTVANPTPLLGAFLTDRWARGTSDIDVRELLHGYNLVFWDDIDGLFRADPVVVSAIAVTEDAAGNRSYTFSLQRDLLYSDGSPITAWDYAFSVLFRISPELRELSAVSEEMDYLVGFDQYSTGALAYLSGVRVPDDYTITFTVRADALPFFYEFGRLSCEPLPVSLIAPGVVVRDDGQGIYLANEDPFMFVPVFNANLLRETLFDSDFAYLAFSSGPYTLTSFDGVTAEFAKNPYYKGNAYGELPLIDTLTYTLAENATMVQKLRDGEFDVINKAADAEAIARGIELTGDGGFRLANYPRTGLGFLSFVCERKTVSTTAARQAIAWCMDRDAIVRDYTGTYGLRADGYYGIGQWMYRAATGAVDYPRDAEPDAATLDAWNALSLDGLTAYTADPERANAILDADGWLLNASGIREKWVDGFYTQLDLTLAYPEGTRIRECLEEHFVPYLEQCGIHLTLLSLPTQQLFLRYYGRLDREVNGRPIDMFFLGSNFDLLFDPALFFTYDGNPYGPPQWLYTGYAADDLYNLAVAMRSTEPGNVLEYMQEWVAFQEKLNEQLPVLPIYSNVYFDFYRADLQNYNVAERVTWSQAILGAYLAEPEEPAEETLSYPAFTQPQP